MALVGHSLEILSYMVVYSPLNGKIATQYLGPFSASEAREEVWAQTSMAMLLPALGEVFWEGTLSSREEQAMAKEGRGQLSSYMSVFGLWKTF